MIKKVLFSGILISSIFLGIVGCSNSGSDVDKKNDETKSSNIKTEAIIIEKSINNNPILGYDNDKKMRYSADPAALVVGDTVYLYSGHDTSSGNNYVIPEWQCYSSKDLVNWNFEGVIMKGSQISWASDPNAAWASQVSTRYSEEKGKDLYYLYFCTWDKTSEGKQSIGVAVSESPTGPFTDIGKPLVKGTVTTNESSSWNDIDPTVWIEEDESGVERRYLSWGNGKLYVCELNEDMVSIKDINLDGKITFGVDIVEKKAPESFTEAPWIYRRQDENGKYYGDYYLFYAFGWREQMAYATTDDLMNGEFEYKGIIMEPTATSNTNHMSVIDFNKKTYFIYHNGSLPKGSGYRRVTCMEELIFNEDGSIPYIKETATGVFGFTNTISSSSGEMLYHKNFKNSSSDSAYPLLNINVGTNIKGTTQDDGLWVITPGRYQPENENHVSIQSYNKPGLYFTDGMAGIKLSQDSTGYMGKQQTFKTVKGLNGKGVSFESLTEEGKFITLVSNILKLTDGSDKDAASFIINK